MKICFPARKANGEQYATVDEMMQPLCQEPHGSWLAGTNNMWHGGIHITRKSAPGSVLTSETADTAVPLQFMAGGEVVAWRIDQDYLTGKYINNPLQYSSTFVLVKSTCTPEPEKKDNSLDFYSLYIGLAPLSAFPEHKLYQVTERGDGLSQREYTGQEKDGDKAPVAKDKLKAGNCVIVLREISFDLKGQTQTFGLARMLNSKSEMTGGAFWMSLDSQFVTPVGEQRAHLPAWMQQAVTQGTFDTVVKPATKMEVAAGDAVGYLAEDIAPCDLHGVEKSAFVHIEVLSTDSRMIDFLSNKAQVKSGPKYVYIHPESFIYSRSGDNFTQTRGKVKKDIHKIMPQDKCHPFKDSNGKRWFDIGDGAWVSDADADADIGQYDLDKQGFKAFEEPSTSDMTKSLHEGWVKDGFTRMAEWVRPERGIREKQVSDYYKALLQKMDSDNSGDLSGEELRHAVNYAELDVRDIAARMVVRHDSEWFGGSSHHRWRTFLKQMDPLCVSYVRQWFDDMEWMSKVEGFSSGEPVWHMHPIVFLNAIAEKYGDTIDFNTTLGIYRISKKSAEFILSWEAYAPKPYVPGGDQSSGVTVGYGYDLGQQTTSSARELLSVYYSNAQVERLLTAIGKKGDNARAIVHGLADIIISKDKALDMAMVLKQRYCQKVVDAYPQAINLPPDSAGAMLSLIYNRGPSLALPKPNDPIDSRREMREIRDDFAQGNEVKIPSRLRSMKRLWSNQRGLIRRREGEAQMIENELGKGD
ncbi:MULTISPECIES: pesticin C-terminus-like muramidase [unclassified Enterobacter]|uniref:pesticin C-terminus-like muramidase n=1 Tax=unclassified Enterobacter TaxID=2608935 RepID=UPI0003ECE310|nr:MULTISPECIES: pesticin C-terminus-like muramidase [unclassified Enterobacter]EWG64817.1 Phage-related lysozyme (muraminidase) [Enterobacter sp. DC3]EWG75084.1 Phage-related lysozyme (muraminidase) [Enterobacter sp. DC4]